MVPQGTGTKRPQENGQPETPGTFALPESERNLLDRVKKEFPNFFPDIPESEAIRYVLEWTWTHAFVVSGEQEKVVSFLGNDAYASEEDAQNYLDGGAIARLVESCGGKWRARIVPFMRVPF